MDNASYVMLGPHVGTAPRIAAGCAQHRQCRDNRLPQAKGCCFRNSWSAWDRSSRPCPWRWAIPARPCSFRVPCRKPTGSSISPSKGTGSSSWKPRRGPRLTRAGHVHPQRGGRTGQPRRPPPARCRRRPDFRAPDARDIGMARDGTLSADGVPVAQIGLVMPADPVTMTRAAGTLFAVDGDVIPVEAPQSCKASSKSGRRPDDRRCRA